MKKLLPAFLLGLLLLVAIAAVGPAKYVGTFTGNALGATNISGSNIAHGTISGDRIAASRVTYRGQARTVSNLFTTINVRDFGAKGDGVTDDWAAIQAAIYFSSSNAGAVYLPPGTYPITDTLVAPYAGALGLTNRFILEGDAWANTILLASGNSMTNKNMLLIPGYWTPLPVNTSESGHAKVKGIWFKGPHNANSAMRYNGIAAVPYSGACIAIGNTNTYSTSNILGAFDTVIEECRLEYNRFGLAMTNCQSLYMRDNWIQLNGQNIIFAHVDSVQVYGGHYGTLLTTNRNQNIKGWSIIGTPGSTWGGTAADSGVHKIISGIEHEGPFLYADGALVTVIGGQFEIGEVTGAPLTNGWCHFTNKGNYNFIGGNINLPPNTNTVLFSLHNGASGGLKLRGVNLGGWDALYANPRCLLFDITRLGYTDTNLYLPYWETGAHGQDASLSSFSGNIASDNEANINARSDGNRYFHIKQRGADTLNIPSFRANGRRFVTLDYYDGNDKNGLPLTNQPHAAGPFRANMQTYFNDPNDLMYGWAMCYDPTVTSFSPWYFPPLQVTPNADGTMPRFYRITVPVICTNAFTNNITFDLYSLKAGGSQQANASGSWGYYSATNIQNYVGTLMLADEPTSPVSIRWGVNAGAWAITNRFFFFPPKLEYW